MVAKDLLIIIFVLKFADALEITVNLIYVTIEVMQYVPLPVEESKKGQIDYVNIKCSLRKGYLRCFINSDVKLKGTSALIYSTPGVTHAHKDARTHNPAN